MRIAIDGRMYGAASTTGIGVYIEQLTSHLFRLDQKNEYVLLLQTPVLKHFKAPRPSITAVAADIPWYSWSEQVLLPRILRRIRPAGIHFPHFNVPLITAAPFIVTIHDTTAQRFPGPRVKHSIIRQTGYRKVFNHALQQSRSIIAISHHTKEQLIRDHGVPVEKIEVIYLGVDPGFNQPVSIERVKAVQEKYSIRKPYLLYVGVWRDHKNLEGLVSAFGVLRQRYGLEYQLVLGGTPDQRYPEIIAAVNHSAYRADIIQTGFVPDDALAALYRGAAAFILPSFSEGFGLVALEALAAGTRVVASTTTSVPEILGPAASYFNPADPAQMAETIFQAIQTPLQTSQYEPLRERYQWSQCAQKTTEVYQRAFGS